ncbi:Bifunctional protein FolD 4, chloroplastic [Trebouxia sp. C0009 RCD-2024]
MGWGCAILHSAVGISACSTNRDRVQASHRTAVEPRYCSYRAPTARLTETVNRPASGKGLRTSTRMAAQPVEADIAEKTQQAELIDGKAIAQTIRKEVAAEVVKLREKYGKSPGLAVVLVGSRKDSETYVRNKKKACEEVGIESFGSTLPEDVTEEEVLKVVQGFNADPAVHGILVQLPLPKHINEQRILDAVSSKKDVDGFHPQNIGCLAMRTRDPLFICCTPKGCIELLERSGVQISGKSACVVGRSNIVGTPAAMLLQRRDATVTVVHSRTPNGQEICSKADIVIAACGKPEMITGDWIKEGAVVIDVGINAVDDPSAKRGYRLVGDVNFAEAKQKASQITPVPGGVGPMTIAMLMQNTLEGAERTLGSQK